MSLLEKFITFSDGDIDTQLSQYFIFRQKKIIKLKKKDIFKDTLSKKFFTLEKIITFK